MSIEEKNTPSDVFYLCLGIIMSGLENRLSEELFFCQSHGKSAKTLTVRYT